MLKLAPSIRDYIHHDYLEPDLRKLIDSGKSNLMDLTYDADEVSILNIKPLVRSFTKDISKRPDVLIKYYEEDPFFQSLIAPLIIKHHKLKDIKPTQVFVGNGNYSLFKEVISFLIGKEIMIGNGPQFPEFPSYFTSLGGKYLPVFNKENWSFPINEILDKLKSESNISIVFLDIPSNSTGAFLLPLTTESIIEEANKKGTIVVVDEAYSNYLPPEQTVANLVNNYHNLIVIRSLSKALDLGGIRFGYSIMSEELANIFKNIHSPFEPSMFSVLCAKYVFENYEKIQKKLDKSIESIMKYRKKIIQLLGKKGITPFPSHEAMPQIMFYKKNFNLFKYFIDRKIVVRSGEMYKFTCPIMTNEYVRLRHPLKKSSFEKFVERIQK